MILAKSYFSNKLSYFKVNLLRENIVTQTLFRFETFKSTRLFSKGYFKPAYLVKVIVNSVEKMIISVSDNAKLKEKENMFIIYRTEIEDILAISYTVRQSMINKGLASS